MAKKLKFRDITKKPKKKDINLLTGKSVKRKTKSKKQLNAKDLYEEGNNEYTSLNVEVHTPETVGIAGSIQHLPKDIQRILNNSIIKQVKVTGNSSMYILNEGFTIKITDTTLGNHKKKHIVIKQKKKTLIDITI